MTIPDRYRLSQITPELIDKMSSLCDQIEDGLESGSDVSQLMIEWHRHSCRMYGSDEFANYWKSMSREQFVLEAVNPPASFVGDVTYSDVVAILESLINAEVDANESAYYLDWLEAQFPDSNINDLIYWPDEWFGDATLFREQGGAFKPDVELSPHQIIAYAMKKSGRFLNDRPRDVELPYPEPQ